MRKILGVTLFEILLVLVIASGISLLAINYTVIHTHELQRDRASLQYQQLLNAGLAYYLANSAWPASLSALNTAGFIPTATVTNPWGGSYSVTPGTGTAAGLLVVSSTVSNSSDSIILAGMLPMAYSGTDTGPPATPTLCTSTSTGCTVYATVPIPGQNLNNARSVNFGNLYHHGACVVAPVCPANMTAEIFAIPVSVGGYSDPSSNSLYPISSFSAYAYGQAATSATTAPGTTPVAPALVADCDSPTTSSGCYSTAGTKLTTTTTPPSYWRVCLNIWTAKGNISSTNTSGDWADKTAILAITRCVPGNPASEPVGSDFTVYTN